MKIAIGSDHGGINIKKPIMKMLEEKGIEYKDFGTYDENSCDYPDYALLVAESVADNSYDCGILLCGTGIGISIAANKVKGIRAAVVCNEFTANASKAHNNANIICMGGRVTTPENAVKLVNIWLDTEFEGDRHSRRLAKIANIESKYMK